MLTVKWIQKKGKHKKKSFFFFIKPSWNLAESCITEETNFVFRLRNISVHAHALSDEAAGWEKGEDDTLSLHSE